MTVKKKDRLENKKRKIVTKFWKKSDSAIDTSINFTKDLGKKTEDVGNGIFSFLHKGGKEIAEKTQETKDELMKQGKKISKDISSNTKGSSSEKDIKTLKKLAELKDQGILTEKEFLKKKKELLEKI